MEEKLILKTTNLTKKFKKLLAVDQLDLTIKRGDVFGFLGPNGAGKSTTIRMLLGLIKPTRGNISIFNKSLSKGRKSILARIGALVEKPSFYNYLPAKQNLKIFAELTNSESYKNIDSVLDIVDLTGRATDKVGSYSQGMKQRLGIAQALLGNPELIILDEPTSGLDPQGMKDIRQLILKLAERGMTIFLSSHLLHEVEQICNKMAIINNGKLLVQGDVETLMDSEKDYISLRVDRIDDTIQLLKDQKWISAIESGANEIKILIDKKDIPDMNSLLVNSGIKVYAIQPRRSLEDYFLSILEAEYD